MINDTLPASPPNTPYAQVSRVTCRAVTRVVPALREEGELSPHGRQPPWIPMFRKELCVPSAFVPSVYSVSKMSFSISVQKFKHRVHRRLLPGDYTEYLKVQRIHRKASPSPSEGGDVFFPHKRRTTITGNHNF